MQFKITLKCLEKDPIIPINYQYELSAWIYKVIAHADAEYANFLHQNGYKTGRKSFKFFCFSRFYGLKYEVAGDRLHIKSSEISFTIGFYLDRTAEEFVRGLFSEQQFRLGDRISGARFSVQTVELQVLRLSQNENSPVFIRLLSPLMIGKKHEGTTEEYLHPSDPDFEFYFWFNLLEKYRAATGSEIPADWTPEKFQFRPIGSEPRSKLIWIKSGTDAETKVKAYLFDFEIIAPRELVEIGLLAGWGRMNGEGFGFGEVA